MCSLFDYLANKLSKDKNVDSSVNISGEKRTQNLLKLFPPNDKKAFTFHVNTFPHRSAPTCASKISLLLFRRRPGPYVTMLLTIFKTGSVNSCPAARIFHRDSICCRRNGFGISNVSRRRIKSKSSSLLTVWQHDDSRNFHYIRTLCTRPSAIYVDHHQPARLSTSQTTSLDDTLLRISLRCS